MKRLLVLAAAVGAAGVSFATEYTWSGGSSGDWTSSANWGVAEGYPKAGDKAIFTTDVTITTTDIDLGGEAGTTATLTNSIASGKTLTFDVSIFGNGGVEREGDGTLKLKKTNPFTGKFISHGTTAQTKGRTYVYASDAFGTDSADFHYDRSPTTSTYAPLYLDAGGATLTNSYPLAISYNHNDMNNGIHFTNGKFVFKDTVTARNRFDGGVDSNVTEIRFEGDLVFGSGAWVDMQSWPSTCHVYFLKPFKASASWYMASSSAYFHFCAPSNDFTYYSTIKIGSTTCYVGQYATKQVCETNDVYVARTRPNSFGWLTDQGDTSRIDLNGFDQKFPVLMYGSVSKATDYGFTSPAGKPAQVILEGNYKTNLTFNGKFFGTAGLTWNPTTDYEFVFTNAVSPTAGTIDVGHGRVRLAKGASFTSLGKLKVADGARFVVDAGAANQFWAAAAEIAEGGAVDVAAGVMLRFERVTTNGAPVAAGVYSASELDGFSGEGTVAVYRSNAWTGGASGDWNDPDNWERGVPVAGDAATIAGNVKVRLDTATPNLCLLEMSGAATLVVSNWNTCVWADQITLTDTAKIAVAGWFTNEVGKSRIHLKCKNFSMAKGTLLDADKKGWSGGQLTGTPDGAGNIHKTVKNAAGLSRGGWGPGAGRGIRSPASHLGLGGYAGERSDYGFYYDDPLAPTEPGSGGYGLGNEEYGVYAQNTKTTSNGGGAVRIEATGKVTVDGQILASAGGACTHFYFWNGTDDCNGGGSGGSVYITCSEISGAGEIRADGGNGNYANTSYNLLETQLCEATLPGGGGGIAIVYDPAKQVAGACRGMTISAAGGTFDGIHTARSSSAPLVEGTQRRFGTMDRYRTAAEPGTLYFSDAKLVADTIGGGLSGRILGLAEYVHEGDLNLTNGHVRFAATGVTVRVTGNLTIAGEWARFDLGGSHTVTNFAMTPYVTAGNRKVSFTVDGNVTVSNGAALAVYAGATGFNAWGGEVTVGGAFTVGAGGHVYPTSDFGNGGSPRFVAGSFTLEEGGEVDADWRGCSGAWACGNYTYSQKTEGIGPNISGGKVSYGGNGASAGHGGRGAISLNAGNPARSDEYYGNVCDDPYEPTYAGAGGGCGGYGHGGAGGGVFHLTSTGAVAVAGSISANGLCPSVTDAYGFYAGGGAGGTISLAGATVTGAATAALSARGGDSRVINTANTVPACGGGGRVSLWGGADVAASGRRTCARHGTTQAFAANEGQIVWLGAIDVGGGTNILKTAGLEQYPSTHGGVGTVFYNLTIPAPGLLYFIR